ncbi:wax ester/triacylglycerol synthase family O-acyltransferase, partial [Enterococcus faecium]|uniref:wax ester/triacylglycerol synthase domain-containing protein n=1 Tax=Enterococcus faecium TaxID=1352 RepID=UPI00396D495A
LCLKPGRLKGFTRAWQMLDEIDTEHHIRHSALPAPGGERELGVLTSRLHGQALDLRRPPWECQIIEGLEHNRFAIYLKVHHALIDGVGG